MVISLFCLFSPDLAVAHTVDDVAPFHLTSSDFFRVTVGGGTFAAPAGVTVRLTPVGGGAAVDATSVEVVPNVSIGARLPASIAAGQYDVSVLIASTPSDAPPESLWVRDRALRLIKRTLSPNTFAIPVAASGADFKEADFADVDGNGVMDVFAANSAGATDVDILYMNRLNDASPACTTDTFCDETAARFTKQPGLVVQRTYDADFVDVDKDGDLDLVRIDQSTTTPIRVFENNGSGTFNEKTIDSGGTTGYIESLSDVAAQTGSIPAVDWGDVNGDGDRDILLCDWFGNRVSLLLNRLSTSGKFETFDHACAGGTPHALCDTQSPLNRGCGFGDFNNDGRLDILAPPYGGGNALVLLNTGNNNPTDKIPQFNTRSDWVKDAGGTNLNLHAGQLKVVDLDGDGDDDAAIASPGQGGTPLAHVFWNDNGTRLVEISPGPSPAIGDTYDVTFSDLDRDGDFDILFANEFAGSAQSRVLLNKGGTNANLLFAEATGIWKEEQLFGPPSAVTTPGFELSVSTGDYDLDGDADVLGAGFNAKLGLWENGLFHDDGERRDWVFALDRTLSMVSGGKDFFLPAKNVLTAFLGERYGTDTPDGDRVGLVTFDYAGSDASNACAADTEGGVDVKAQQEILLGAANAATMITHVNGLVPGSCTLRCTSVGAAMRSSLQMALTGAPEREKVVVVATDGKNNQCPKPADVIGDFPSNVRVYAVGLGNQTDDSDLAMMATNAGKFYVAGRSTDYTSVQSALRDIDADLEAHATGQQVLAPLPVSLIRQWSKLMERAPRIPVLGHVNLRAHRFAVDPADRDVRFTMSWREPSNATGMVVIDPKGRVQPIAGDDRATSERGERFHIVEVQDPLSGIWTVVEQPDQARPPGPIKVTGMASSDLKLDGKGRFPIFRVGEKLSLELTLAKPERMVPVGAITATFLSPADTSVIVQGSDLGNGKLAVEGPATTEPGTWRVDVIIAGTPERPFTRMWHSAIHVAAPQPDAPDLRRAELTLSGDKLRAGSPDTLKARAKFFREDGASLTGAQVSFSPRLAEMVGSVTDHGDGSYSQDFRATRHAGPGEMRARVGVFQFANAAAFSVGPGKVNLDRSHISVLIGPLQLCAGDPTAVGVEARLIDEHGNPMVDQKVAIEQSGGPAVKWIGDVTGGGGLYRREFRGPRKPGVYEFTANVDGEALPRSAKLDVYGPDSPEGKAWNCQPVKDVTTLPWWLWLFLLLLLLVIILFILRRRGVI